MSEQTKEADIVERLLKHHDQWAAGADFHGLGFYEDLVKEPTIYSVAADEITRLRALLPSVEEGKP